MTAPPPTGWVPVADIPGLFCAVRECREPAAWAITFSYPVAIHLCVFCARCAKMRMDAESGGNRPPEAVTTRGS